MKVTEKFGEWIVDDYGYHRCSECGFEYDRPEEISPYCPICGAYLISDLSDDEEE